MRPAWDHPRPALAPGSIVGTYRIVASLGVGGMGEVYRATDIKLEREVAIKVLPTALARDSERLARFEREAKVLASLSHPNIATIYAIEESSEGKAIAMELVPGNTLKGRCRWRRPSTMPNRLRKPSKLRMKKGSHTAI